MEEIKQSFIHWLINESEDFQLTLFLGLVGLFTLIELIAPARKFKVNRKSRWTVNYLITSLNLLFLISLPISFMTASLYAEGKEWGLLNLYELPFGITLVVSLLLRGFISFFTHYLMHKIPFLWRLHRVHHLDTQLDVSTTVRGHPFEFIGNLIIGIPLVIGFGLPIWAQLFYELLDLVVVIMSHSNIQLPWGIEKFLRYIIVTPDIHKIHHSSLQRETDSNYSALFPIWDILFGTFKTRARKHLNSMNMGLDEIRDQRSTNLIWLIKSPWLNIKRKNEVSRKNNFR